MQGAAGNLAYAFDVTNHGSQPCPLGGYFGVSVYDPQGDVITTTVISDTSTPPQPVRLAAGGTAHLLVLVSISSPTGNSRDCPLIGAFHLIPPNATSAVQVSISPSVDGRDCGSVNVGATKTF